MHKLMRYIKGYEKQAVLAPLFKMLEATFELFVPLVVASIIDTGIKNGDAVFIWQRCGLLILLAVIAMFLMQTARISKRNQPLWVLMLPIPVIYLLVCELVDCFTMLSTGSPMLYWLCLLMGAVDAQARRLKPQALPKLQMVTNLRFGR